MMGLQGLTPEQQQRMRKVYETAKRGEAVPPEDALLCIVTYCIAQGLGNNVLVPIHDVAMAGLKAALAGGPFDAQALCECGHTASEHERGGRCHACECPSFEETDA